MQIWRPVTGPTNHSGISEYLFASGMKTGSWILNSRTTVNHEIAPGVTLFASSRENLRPDNSAEQSESDNLFQAEILR